MLPLLFTGIFFIVVGALLLALGLKNRRAMAEASSWPIVPAIITSSECHSSGEEYRPLVSYSYEIEGKTYRDSTLLAAPEVVARERLEKYIDQMYAVGRRVYVSVDPKNYACSALEPDSNRGNVYTQLVLGAVLLVSALVLLISCFLY